MEDIIIVVIVFGSALAALKLILDFVQSNRGIKSRGGDRSLTTSELADMIDEAVSAGTRDLVKRVQNLEAIVVDQPVLPEHHDQDRIQLPDESLEARQEASAKARLRS